MRYLLFLLLFSFCALNSNASHMLGYDMEFVNIRDANNNPTDTYKWRLRFYRDVTGIPIPNAFSFTIYRNSDNGSAGTFTVTKINPQTFISYSTSLCAPIQAQNRVELGIYESPVQNYASLNSANGYYAATNHCCRNTGIVNVFGPSDSYGMLMLVEIPRLNPGVATRFNNSPKFKEFPLYGYSVGKLYTIDWSAIDPDGDSLVYTIVKPLDDGPTKPNFSNIEYPSGYSLGSNIADGNPDMQIDSKTGIITYKPTIANKYLIALKVEEYRKISGVPTKIGEVRREMQIQTFISIENPPVLFDSLTNSTIVDTITANSLQTKILNFISNDHPNDSLFMRIIAEPGALSNNILDTNLIDAAWSDSLGNSYRGQNAEQFIVKGKGSVFAKLIVKADSNSTSIVPYKFKVISYDKTCFVPLADTLNYELYVLGNPCYSTVSSSVTACDSFVAINGKTYFQSTVLMDTIRTVVGCNMVTIQNINIIPSPIANFNNLNIYVTDTSKVYSYKVDSQANAFYQWLVSSNGSIVSGINTNSIDVKWNTDTAIESIVCFITRVNCFDSVSTPIVVSHITGIEKYAIKKLEVYPNPVENKLMFNTNEDLNSALISIYNTIGQKIAESRIYNNQVDVSNLIPGVYTFKLDHRNVMYRGKFVK